MRPIGLSVLIAATIGIVVARENDHSAFNAIGVHFGVSLWSGLACQSEAPSETQSESVTNRVRSKDSL